MGATQRSEMASKVKERKGEETEQLRREIARQIETDGIKRVRRRDRLRQRSHEAGPDQLQAAALGARDGACLRRPFHARRRGGGDSAAGLEAGARARDWPRLYARLRDRARVLHLPARR